MQIAKIQTSQASLTNSTNLSAYLDGQVSQEVKKDCFAILKSAFPKLDNDFFRLLDIIIKENKFSDDRLKNSIKSIVENNKFAPTISDILTTGKRVVFYTYEEILEKSKDLDPNSRKNYLSQFKISKSKKDANGNPMRWRFEIHHR